LDFGQLIIAGMKATTGAGSPDIGAQFAEGHKGFNTAGEALRSAVPDDRWDGAGSRAYADQNTRQQVRTETMADADQAVYSVLVREALQIKLRRDTLDDQSDLLARTGYATFPLQFIPRYGEAAKLAIESAALQGTLLVSAHALYELQSEVSANAAELGQAVGRYAGVADGADPPGDGIDFNPPPQLDLPQPVVPAGTSAAPAPMTGMPAAGQRAQVEDVEDEDVGEDGEGAEAAEGDRDGDRGDQVATAGPGHGAAERAPVGAEVDPDTSPGGSDGTSPQVTKLGDGADGGG